MTVISNEYASALFSVAVENKCLKDVYDSVLILKSVFENTENLFQFLKTPAIPKTTRLEAIKNAFYGRVNVFVYNLICIMCENKSLDIAFEFIDEFFELYERSQKITKAFVVTASKLDDTQIKNLTDKLESISGHKVILDVKIDESLLGGMTVAIDNKFYDGSVLNKLKSIKEVMNGELQT